MKIFFLAFIFGMTLVGCATAQKLPELMIEYRANLSTQNFTANADSDFEMNVGISVDKALTEITVTTEIDEKGALSHGITDEENGEIRNPPHTEYLLTSLTSAPSIGQKEILELLNFLSQEHFFSIFSFGTDRYSGELYSFERDYNFEVLWFNVHGEPVASPLSIPESKILPAGFSLLDTGNNGFLDVMIFYSHLTYGYSHSILYRFTGGEYQQMVFPLHILYPHLEELYSPELSRFSTFFVDSSSNNIILYGDDVRGWSGYYHLDFSNNVAMLTPIIRIEWDGVYDAETSIRIGSFQDIIAHWGNHREHCATPIFGRADIPISSLHSFSHLESQIRESIRFDLLY